MLHEKIHNESVHDGYDRSGNGMPDAMEHVINNLMPLVVRISLNRHALDLRVD